MLRKSGDFNLPNLYTESLDDNELWFGLMNSALLQIDGDSKDRLHLTGRFMDGTLFNASATDVYPNHDANGGELCMRWDKGNGNSYNKWGDRACDTRLEYACMYDCDNIRGNFFILTKLPREGIDYLTF